MSSMKRQCYCFFYMHPQAVCVKPWMQLLHILICFMLEGFPLLCHYQHVDVTCKQNYFCSFSSTSHDQNPRKNRWQQLSKLHEVQVIKEITNVDCRLLDWDHYFWGMLVTTYKTTWHHNLEDNTLHIYCHENLKSQQQKIKYSNWKFRNWMLSMNSKSFNCLPYYLFMLYLITYVQIKLYDLKL